MPNSSAAALGEIIRQQRELAELSIRQFAELAGISNPYLPQIERRLRAPSAQVLESIAETLVLSTSARYQPAGLTSLGEDARESAMLDAVAADPCLTSPCRASRTESSARRPQTASRGK
jgi:transcriptional regulator with XRE-family HTH domain